MREKAAAFFRKQKKEQWMLYFLLAAIGVVLLLPTGTKKTSEETEQPQETAARPAGDAGLSVQEEMEQRLCDALSQMDGVGAVHVVVTLESTVCTLLTRTTFNMFAMIAFIMLMGLVVKNGILLVDFANQARREEGKSITEALVAAGHIRLRPILMTTAAMVFGMLPMAAALQEGADGTMGRSIIGGVLSSTVLTLVVVPVIYAMIEEFKARRAAKKAARRAASAGAAVSGAEVPAE